MHQTTDDVVNPRAPQKLVAENHTDPSDMCTSNSALRDTCFLLVGASALLLIVGLAGHFWFHAY